MPKRESVDLPTRRRIAAYVRIEWRKYRGYFGDGALQRDFAKKLGVDPGTVSKILARKLDASLDIALALIRNLHVPAEMVLNQDPPEDGKADVVPPSGAFPSAGPGGRGEPVTTTRQAANTDPVRRGRRS